MWKGREGKSVFVARKEEEVFRMHSYFDIYLPKDTPTNSLLY